jgi:1,4-dihydroxy-2-naphthoate octaprenyltransferase
MNADTVHAPTVNAHATPGPDTHIAPSFADVCRICELRTKIVSVSSLAIGTLCAAQAGAFSWATFFLMLAATLCVDLATAGFNSYYDHRFGVDTRSTDVDGYKVLVWKPIDPRVALWVACALFAGAVVLGLAIGARVGWEVIGVGALCMLIAWAYSGGPYPISRTPVGEIFAGGGLGLVLTVLAAYVHTHRIDPQVVAIGIPGTLIIASILAANNACDRMGDAAGGRLTLAMVLGARGAVKVVELLVGAGFGIALALAASGVLPTFSVVPLALAALLAMRKLTAMHAKGYDHPTKGFIMGGISQIFAAYTAAIVVSQVVALVM